MPRHCVVTYIVASVCTRVSAQRIIKYFFQTQPLSSFAIWLEYCGLLWGCKRVMALGAVYSAVALDYRPKKAILHVGAVMTLNTAPAVDAGELKRTDSKCDRLA